MTKHFNIADMYEMVADRVPARDALVCGERRATYVALEQRANQLAHYLAARGVGAGDHVGLYLYNCNEYLEAMLACFKLRAVPINVNYRYVEEELLYIFTNANMVACVHNQEFSPHIAAVKSGSPDLASSGVRSMRKCLPMTSDPCHPLMRAAPAFHEVINPFWSSR